MKKRKRLSPSMKSPPSVNWEDKIKILLLGMESLNWQNIIRVIKKMNCETILLTNSQSLFEKISAREGDVLIVDIRLAREIKNVEKFDQELPLIWAIPRGVVPNYEDLNTINAVGFIRENGKANSIKRAIKLALKRRERNLVIQNSLKSLKRKVRELEILNEIVRAINSSLKPKEIIQIIMEKTADLIEAEGWSVLLLDRERKELVFEAAAGEAGKKLIGLRLNLNQGIAGWVARTGKSVIVGDVAKDKRFYAGVDEKTKFVTKSILCVPMKSRDKIIGVVEVVNKIGGEPFTKDDLRIFENLVEHVTIALLNAQLYRQMEKASITDDLTKLYNTRYCNQVLDELIKKGNKTSLIFLDVDYFKLVDDNYGHLVGSDTLKLIGERIRATIRERDLAVRYGGDEYIVVLPNTEKKDAARVAERIRQAIGTKPFYAGRNKKFFVSVTIGVATYPDDAKTRDNLIGKADKAMYEGKMTGRNKVVLA
uniref:Sensor domain-containing diguanylate cyclase n=1 Tax=candidate division WOR-3 bacterium TaxID=2052148 RepID=A0A7C4XLX1_UNCW3